MYEVEPLTRNDSHSPRPWAVAAILLALMTSPFPARGEPGPSRLTVESVGAADGGSSSRTPLDTGAVRRLLTPHLSRADLAVVLSSSTTVARLSRLLDVLASPDGRDQYVEVEVAPAPGGGRTVYVSLRHKGPLERSSADRSWRQESAVTVGEVAIFLRPPPPAPVIAMPAPVPLQPDVLPTSETPCAPGDADCWRRGTLRQLSLRPPACETYLVEQDAHLARLGLAHDANGAAAKAPVPDPTAPERDRQQRMSEWAGAYPTGEIDQGFESIARRDLRIVNSAPCTAPRPSLPADACFAEWAEGSIASVPTLACTREVVDHQHWRVGDGLVRAAEAPFSPLGSLPIISHILAAKARRVADDTSWRGVFAVRWMERLADARARGDLEYMDRVAANLAGAPEERRILATHLRRWMTSAQNAPWHATIRAFYEERFTALYPDAADSTGMPVLSRFPTRLWWATNWLSEVMRRGMAAEAAAGLLRCCTGSGEAVAVLKDLAPHLAADPRFGGMVGKLVAML